MKPIDPRLQNLSYSTVLNLHSCPRRFQLDKLQAQREEQDDPNSYQAVTFGYGHVVGLGIQLAMEDKTEAEIVWQMFLMWEPDLFAQNERQAKSFWLAVVAVQQFLAMRASGYLADYQLVQYQGKPACELSFRVTFPDGFKYRGFVDVVLQHRISGEVIVLELKTSSATSLNPATYKNSLQALSYSMVIDTIFPALSSFQVLYLVYATKTREYHHLQFPKTAMQKALAIRELMLDIETIKMYHEEDVFPMRGESCFNFYRECHYLNLCTLSTELLTDPLQEGDLKQEEFQIELTLADLIKSQLAASSTQSTESEES
jgi:RecB family exonuclease